MIRKLKALGLALIAVLALSGIVAVAAQAETAVESELKAPAVTNLDVINDPTGKSHDGARITIGNGARYVECEVFDFDGKIVGSATPIKGTAEFTKCFANGLTTFTTTVTHNKCNLSLTPLKDTTATTTISCPEGTPTEIQIHIYENEKADKENKPLCTYDITLKTPQVIAGAKISTTGAAGKTHALTLDLSGTSKLKDIYNTGPGGLAVCGVAVNKHAEASFAKQLTLTGTEATGAKGQVGITLLSPVVDTPVESNLAAPAETILDVNDVTGTEDGKLARLTIGTGARYIECTQAKQFSNAAIVGSANAVSATPKFETCFGNATKTAIATVAHNGCTVKVTATKEQEGKVLGDATIECAEGKQIEARVFENEKTHAENKPLCTYDIKGGQTLTGAEITAGGSGETADLSLNLSTLSKLKLTNTGPGELATCGIASGAEGTGAFSGKITVSGTSTSGTQVGVKLG